MSKKAPLIPCIMLGCTKCGDQEQVSLNHAGEIGIGVLVKDLEKFYCEHRRESLGVDGLRCETFHLTVKLSYV